MTTDLLIIGGGPGGYKTAEYAARKGLKVVLAERAKLGGTCLNCGCIPTKSLLHDAAKEKSRQDIQPAPDSLQQAFAAAIARKDQVVAGLTTGVEGLMQHAGVTVVHGEAQFINSHEVQVGEEKIEAQDIIIATGSQPKMLRLEAGDTSKVMTSEELLSCTVLPHTLCIIGAGVIGLEMASIFADFGCEVTIVEYMKECLSTMDQEIARRVRRLLEKQQGIKMILQAGVTRIDNNTVYYNDLKRQKAASIEADAILMAVGRAPQLDGLHLETAGVATTPKGITVDDNMQTSVDHIYAIGDVNGRTLLAHAATFQGYHAVNAILGINDSIDLNVIPAAVFTHPEIASVGQTEEALKAVGKEYTVHKATYRSNGRAQAMEETEGLVKILTDSEGYILGCHIYGAEASAMVQEIAVLMTLKQPLTRLKEIVHIHPTLSEILLDAAE